MKNLIKRIAQCYSIDEMRVMRSQSLSLKRGAAGLPSTESLVSSGVLAKAIQVKTKLMKGEFVNDSSYESHNPLLNRLYKKVDISSLFQVEKEAA